MRSDIQQLQLQMTEKVVPDRTKFKKSKRKNWKNEELLRIDYQRVHTCDARDN